jgi:hypothetical protein
VTQIGSELTYLTPKNYERRRVSIDARTVAALKAWGKVQLGERLAWVRHTRVLRI